MGPCLSTTTTEQGKSNPIRMKQKASTPPDTPDMAAVGVSTSEAPALLPDTVFFDVGGRVYHVARSLLQNHPRSVLSRMADPIWQPREGGRRGDGRSSDATLFVDGNGDRFQYVLDYMRYGEVNLPITVSKKAVLLDLDYYGFDVLGDETANDAVKSAVTLSEACSIITTIEEEEERKLKDLDKRIVEAKKTIKDCEKKQCAIRTASVLFKRSKKYQTKKSTVHFSRGQEYGTNERAIASDAEEALKVKDYLNECLSMYQLEVTGTWGTGWYSGDFSINLASTEK